MTFRTTSHKFVIVSMLLVFSVLGSLLAGCAPAQPTAVPAAAATTEAPATEAPAAEAPAAEPVAADLPDVVTPSQTAAIDWQQFKGTTLNVLVAKHWWSDAIQPLLPQFEQLTGIKVNFDILSQDTYFTKALTVLSSNSPAYDFLMVGNAEAGQYMAGNWLEPLDPYLNNPKLTDLAWYDKDDILQGGMKAGTKDGAQYALPISSEGEMLFYRKDIFEQKGLKPPTTFDELYAVAKELNSPEMAGYVTRGKLGADLMWEWVGVLLSYGGRLLDDQGKPVFNSPEGIAATEMFYKLLKDTGPEGTINWSWMEAAENFAQGKSATFLEAGGIGPVVEKEGNPVVGKVSYVVMPHAEGKSTIPNYWYWMVGIPAGSKQKDAGYLFLEWATSKTLGIPLATAGSSPARESTWNSEEFLSGANPDWAKASVATGQAVQPSMVPYDRPDYPEITEAITVELNNIHAGVKDVKTALDDAAAKVEKIVAEK